MSFQLKPSQLITASFLPATSEVKGFSRHAGYCRLEAVLQDGNNQHLAKNLSPEHLAEVQVFQQTKLAQKRIEIEGGHFWDNLSHAIFGISLNDWNDRNMDSFALPLSGNITLQHEYS